MDSALRLSALKDKVNEAQTRILQDYLGEMLKECYDGREWVDDYARYLYVWGSGKRRGEYAAANKKYKEVGRRSFDVTNMDISQIHRLFVDFLTFDPEDRETHDTDSFPLRLKRIGFALNCYLQCIHDDRNPYSHRSTRESDFLCLLQVGSMISHLHMFRKTAVKDRGLSKKGRLHFSDKWKILTLQLEQELEAEFEVIDEERTLRAEIQSELRRALNDGDATGEYYELLSKYHSIGRAKQRQGTPNALMKTLLLFYKEASDFGFDLASIELGDIYFGDYGNEFWNQDYDIAATYYLRAKKTIDLEHRIRLASMLINGLCEGHDEAEGNKLLQECPPLATGVFGGDSHREYERATTTVAGMTFYCYKETQESVEKRLVREERKKERSGSASKAPLPDVSDTRPKADQSRETKSIFSNLKADEYLRRHQGNNSDN